MPYKDPDVARKRKAEYRRKNRQKLRDSAKKRHQDKRDEHLAYMRQYRIDNYDRRKDADLRRLYGISLSDYRRMLASQNGVCAICCRGNRDQGQWLSVDHCHESGRIRGLLCNRCNLGLGYFDDSQNNLSRAVEYLSRPRDEERLDEVG